jgi:hypothetical protein
MFFASSYFAVSQIRDFASKIKIYHSNPSVDRNTKIVQQLEDIFGTYRMIFAELSEKKQRLSSQGFCRRDEKL